jgi:hypothetical protein
MCQNFCEVSFFLFFQGFFEDIECTTSMSFWLYERNSFSSCLVAFFMACWVLCLGFHPRDLILWLGAGFEVVFSAYLALILNQIG